MQRSLVALLLLAIALATTLSAQPKKFKKTCKPSLATCPDEGCGSTFDANLNRLKNIRTDSQMATMKSLTWMKKLDDPESFAQGDSREESTALGEGEKITVAAHLLSAKPELGGESCNCGLQTPTETDNHLVLVTKTTVDKFPLSSTVAANKTVFHAPGLGAETADITAGGRLTQSNLPR